MRCLTGLDHGLTEIVPIIQEWKMQWYRYVPATVSVTENWSPSLSGPESNFEGPDVVVAVCACPPVSESVQTIVLFRLTFTDKLRG